MTASRGRRPSPPDPPHAPRPPRGTRPPRAVRWLLRLWIDPADLPFVWADLEDGFASRIGSEGRWAGYRWLTGQVRSSFEPWSALRAERAEGPLERPSDRPKERPPRFDRLVRDVSHALRALRRRPLFSGVAILTLAVGIGANTAIFSVVNGLLFKDVAGFDDTDGVVEISRDVDGSFFDLAYPVVRHLRENSEELESIAAVALAPVSLGVDREADLAMSFSVTDDYFDVLRISPLAGRFFSEDEARFPAVRSVAVISARFWERRFESSPDAIGSVLRVNGHPTEIVGVAPRGFGGHAAILKGDIWLPLGLPAPGVQGADQLTHPESGVVESIGRLAPGSSVERARAELTTLATAYLEDTLGRPMEPPHVTRVVPWAPVPANGRAGVYAFLTLLMVLVGLVLAMACLNVSGMLLSRFAERSPELAVRRVLGAGKRRIVRELLTESMVLYAGGALAGLLLAVWVTRLTRAFEPPIPIPGFEISYQFDFDWRVLGFATGIALVTGLAFSLAPALGGARSDSFDERLRAAGRGGSRRRTRLRSSLVAAQMGTTVLLLLGAGLFLRALHSLQTVETGWESEGVTAMNFDLEMSKYTPADGPDFQRELLDRIRAIPGVEAAALGSKLPLAGRSSFGDIRVPGVEPPPNRPGFPAYNSTISEGYFETLGIRLLEGRDFSPADRTDERRLVVINETMADRFWPNESPVGRRFMIGEQPYDVIGVVEAAKYNRLTEEPLSFYYLSADQRYAPQSILYARGDLDGAGMISALRAAAAGLDADLPVLPARDLDVALEVFFLPQRMAAWVAGSMGLVALLLGTVGVYGITAFTVGQRRREIGIRLALGGSRRAVLRRMLRSGLAAPAAGLTAGTAIAIGVTRFLRSFLGGVSPLDPLTFGLVLGGLGAIATLAVLIPTRRATDVDPAHTLRAD